MYIHLLSWVALILQLFPPVVSISSPGALTREVGQDVVFMFNASNSIVAFIWGIRDGNTNTLKQGLMNGDIDGIQFDAQISSTSYAGRVSFVGNLSEGQAWFKITNLNINDTNQCMANIAVNGASGPQYPSVQLTVLPATTTTLPSTLRTTPTSESLTTQHITVLTTNPPTLTNLTTTLAVDGATFSEKMKNTSSFSFKKFSEEFEEAIKDAYSGEVKIKDVKVISLRKGSILVTFVVFFESEIKYDQACAPLEKAIEDGKLGSFKIVPGSLGCAKPKPSPRPPGARTSVHPGIIAGVAVGGVLAVAGLVVAILLVCRKKSSKKDYRSSRGEEGYEMDGRPGEPEEQYASVQRQADSGTKQKHKQQIPYQYAAVEKNKKTKKNTSEPGELVYAELDHGRNASVGTRPPSDGRPISGSDTVYADIQSDRQKKRYPPPQYGNMQDMSYA